jgi:uncharacterized NAD(P)/FAD-binding protein YdhS
MLSGTQPTGRQSERAAGPRRPTVAIVGAGASGTLVATQLLRASSQTGTRLRAVLIDRRERNGGVAYSTSNPSHRLNVTAARMSALPDAPDDFLRWRARTVGSGDPGAYAPRGEYRRYLGDLLGAAQLEAESDVTLARLVADVDAVEPLGSQVRLRFAGGGALDADAAVLALGNLGALPPLGCSSVSAHAAYVNDPWAPGALDRLDPAARGLVLLIGTGLTMVDVAITVAARCPQAQVLAVSRSGLLPRAHLPGRVTPQPATVRLDPESSLPVLVDVILAEAAAGRRCWHQLVDDLRPATQSLWQRLTIEQQASFLATHHRAWCVHRHRMPPEVATMLAELLQSGRLQVRGGSIELATGARDALEARLSGADRLKVALAINCTGPGLNPRASRDPLIRQLLTDGHVRAHPLGVGFDTAPQGAFRSRDGATHRRLFTLGPPRVGELYETTAIPEIREQARELADLLVARLGRGAGAATVGAQAS